MFKQSFSNLLTYRVGILIELLQNGLPALITLMVLMYAKSSSINTPSLISYYLVITISAPLVISSIDEQLDLLSTTGEINNFLTKPISLILMFWTKNLSEKLFTLFYISPLLIILLNYLKLPWLNVILFLLSLPISFTISFLFSFVIGLGCFWLDEFWAIRNVKFVLIQLLGGLIMPYSIMPVNLITILRYTPFTYIGSWSGRILQNGSNITEFIISIIWTIILYMAMQYFLKSAIRHYSHTGG